MLPGSLGRQELPGLVAVRAAPLTLPEMQQRSRASNTIQISFLPGGVDPGMTGV